MITNALLYILIGLDFSTLLEMTMDFGLDDNYIFYITLDIK